MNPLVSIIITTRNSARTLKDLLESVKKQSYKKIEIIVVDNNSSDKTKKIGLKFTKKVYDFGPERSAQRNFGARKAKGSYYLVLDSDMTLEKDVVGQCVSEIRKNNRKEVAIPEVSFGESFWAKSKTLEREINTGEKFFESARFFPKDIFWEANGYDENLTGPEDWDLPQRIARKYKVARIKARIFHNEGDLTLKDLMRKKYYYGLCAHKYLSKNNLSIFSPVTIYLLRPAFYRNWKKMLSHPLISAGMIVMLSFENIAGGFGYIRGRFKSK